MRLLRLLSVSVLALSMGLINAEAQNLRNSNGPAERPPASFKGKQYVDSRGCVFIRAGYGGQVTWVPRVTRSRKQVCNARSSVAPKTTTAKVAPKATRKAAPKTATKVVRGKPPATAKVVRRTVSIIPAAPKTTTRVKHKAPLVPKAQTRVVRRQVQAAPAQQTRRATAQRRVVSICAGASDFSSQFVNKGARCGPQNGQSRTVVREELSPQSSNRVRRERKGPQGVNRKIAEAKILPPKGHKRAFKDDRLNPLRGVGTTSGKAQMALVWSNTVPRYLIDPATGKRATPARRRVLGIF